MRMLHQFTVVLMILMLPGGLAFGATKSKFSPGLSHVTVVINGEKTAVHAGQTLNVYRGDNIVFVRAESREPGVNASTLAIDLEGFRAATGGVTGSGLDVRGTEINTGLLQGKSFKVAVRSGERLFGQIKLVVADPRFDYAVVLVNGSPVTVKQGGKLNLKPSDQIKLESVRSNIPDPAKVEVEAAGGGSLRFKYRGRVFGEIRLPLKRSGVDAR